MPAILSTEKLGKSSREGSFETESWLNGHLQVG